MPGKAKPAADVEQSVSECTPLNGGQGCDGKKAGYEDQEPISLTQHPVLWVQSLSKSYSWRLLAMVVCTNHMLKGFVCGGGDEGLVGKPIEFIFGSMGIPAGRMQMLKAAAIAPWALKPVIAIISDACPIFGYKKLPYVVGTTLLSVGAVFCIGLGLVTSVHMIVACLFLIFLNTSTVDLLVEAKQSEEVKAKPKLAPQFFTFTWLGINIGQVLGVGLVGALLHHCGPRVPYLVAAPFICLVLWPTMLNFLGEKRLPADQRGVSMFMINKHPVLCWMTCLIGLLIVCLIAGTFLLEQGQLIICCLMFAAIVLGSFAIFIRREITGPVVFYFLLGMLSFNVDGALFYFYTDAPTAYPEGPHFTAYFYTAGIGMVTFIGIMIGFISGAELFKNWSYRGILCITIILRMFTQLALVPVLLRWTLAFGISDKAWVLTVTMLDTMVFAWRWIPKQVMGAHLTPTGVEATMLGLTAGTFNMAMILSSYCGGFLLHKLGVTPRGGDYESPMFMSLWRVQVIAAIAPCVMLFLLPVLIPGKTQSEPLIEERRDSATYGSLWENWRRQEN